MSDRTIPAEEIAFHPGSFCDRNGRLFSWNGGLYRGLTAGGAALCRRMFDEGIVAKLVAKKLLIETELTGLTAPGFDLVVKHRRLPFVSYPFEWSPRMLKAAALCIADLEIELAGHGLTLGAVDTSCWNVLFDGGRPVYIDFGSIFPIAEIDEEGYRGFYISCLHPLRLHAAGRGRIAWRLLEDYQAAGITAEDYAALNGGEPSADRAGGALRQLRAGVRAVLPESLRRNLRACLPAARSIQTARQETMRGLRAEAAAIEIADAHESSARPVSDAVTTCIQSLLAVEKPRTVLVVGDGARGIAELAARDDRAVVAMDREGPAVDAQFGAATERVLPVRMDIRFPTPGVGVLNRELPPATERLACDAVIALDCVHRLVFENNLRFNQVVDALAVFAKRLLVVEFVFADSALLRERSRDSFFSWYHIDNFADSMRAQFDSVEIVATGAETALLAGRRSNQGA